MKDRANFELFQIVRGAIKLRVTEHTPAVLLAVNEIEERLAYMHARGAPEAVTRHGNLRMRLARVEEDLAAFRKSQQTVRYESENEALKHNPGGPGTCKHMRERGVGLCISCHRRWVASGYEIRQMPAEEISPCLSTADQEQAQATLSAFGQAPEVLTPEAQEAKCWAVIERWWERQERPEALTVSFDGPFSSAGDGQFYCRLPGRGPCTRGATRLDALAQAAQWCELELARTGK